MNMSPKSRKAKSVDSESESVDERNQMALQILELITDERVLSKLKETMFPQELSNKIDILNTTVATLSSQLREKYAKITLLEERLTKVEEDLDRCEQYSRRPNLRIQGLSDDVRGEDTERKVLYAINVNMGFKPPLEIDQIERCHRLGRVVVGQARPRVTIVRFTKERDRDAVFYARGMLKSYNSTQSNERKIYINEDLTSKRAMLAYESRQLKKTKHINECWTANGRVMIIGQSNYGLTLNKLQQKLFHLY